MPLYVCVKDTVRSAIERGRFQPGEQLPSTKTLSEQMSVSLVTVHRAMQELVANGVLRRGQGRGTFVHEAYAQRSRKTHGLRVGLVIHSHTLLADPTTAETLEGVRRQADEMGIDLVLLRSGEDPRSECQGYLYINPAADQLDRPLRFGKHSMIPNSGLPIVVIGAKSQRSGVVSLGADGAEIGRLAAIALISAGHRCIGFIGSSADVQHDSERLSGFSEACVRQGVDVPSHAVIRSSGWLADASAKRDLLACLKRPRHERPTAMFASGYAYALAAYEMAAAAGLVIPRDLSVIGVDDPAGAAYLGPPLTTFRLPHDKVGRMAITELGDLMLRGGGSGQQLSLTPELVTRESVAAPASTEGLALRANVAM